MIKLLLFTFFLAEGIAGEPPSSITPYRNKHRLILVFAENNYSMEYRQTMKALSTDPLGLDRRDMLIFEIFERGGIQADGSALSEEETAALRKYFRIDGYFTLIILDKRLNEIFRVLQPVAVQEIFNAVG